MVPRCYDFQNPAEVDLVPGWEVLCRSLRHLAEQHITEQQMLVTRFFQDTEQFLHNPDRLDECDVPPDGCPEIPFANTAHRTDVNVSDSVPPCESFTNDCCTQCSVFFPSPDLATTVCLGTAVEVEKTAEKHETEKQPSFLTKDAMKHINLDMESNDYMVALRRRANNYAVGRYLSRCADYFGSLQEPLRSGCLAEFVRSYLFTFLTVAIIILNSLFTIYATNRTIQLNTETETPAMQVIESSFLGIYCIELMLKLSVHGVYFFLNAESKWNIFDFALVTFAIADHVLKSAMDMESLDLTFMRTLRLLKLSKVLRMFRAMRFFAELRLMLDCVAGSVLSLFLVLRDSGFFQSYLRLDLRSEFWSASVE